MFIQNTPTNKLIVKPLGVILLAIMLLPACASNRQSANNPQYHTIPTLPGRNTAEARRLTQEGIRLLTPPPGNHAGATPGTTPGAIGRINNPHSNTSDPEYQATLARAEAKFRGALEADIMYGPAHNNLGQLYYIQERYYEAAWEFQYAGQLMPHQPIPRNNLGLVFEATGQLDKAEEHYALALETEPDNPEFLGNLARAKVRQGERSQELLDLLQQIVVVDTRPQWRSWAEEQLRFIAGRMDE